MRPVVSKFAGTLSLQSKSHARLCCVHMIQSAVAPKMQAVALPDMETTVAPKMHLIVMSKSSNFCCRFMHILPSDTRHTVSAYPECLWTDMTSLDCSPLLALAAAYAHPQHPVAVCGLPHQCPGAADITAHRSYMQVARMCLRPSVHRYCWQCLKHTNNNLTSLAW